MYLLTKQPINHSMKLVQNKCLNCDKLHSWATAFCSLKCAEELFFKGETLGNAAIS